MPDTSTPENSNQVPQISLRSTIDLLQLMWRRRSCLVSMTLGSMVLGLTYWLLAERTYESSADVLVVRKNPETVMRDANRDSGFEDYLATHLALVVSPMIVERAIKESDLASLPSFVEDAQDPDVELADLIIEGLEVEGGPRDLGDNADNIMTLSFRGPVAEDCPRVVQAILDSYEAFHHEIFHGMSDQTVELISQARELLNQDLHKQQDEYSQFRQHSPLISRGTDEVNPLQDRLTAIETQRSELLLRRAEVERQLLAIEKARKKGVDDQMLLAIVSDLRNLATTENGLPNTSTNVENQLVQLADTEQRLLEHYGPNHPHVKMIRERIEVTRRFLALPTAAYVSESGMPDAENLSRASPVDMYTQYLQLELERIELSEKLLSELYEREHETAKELSGYQLTDERFQRNIVRTEELYDAVVSRLQEASLIKDYGGFETRVIAPPRLGEKVSPAGSIVLPVSMFLGFCAGFCRALVVELRDHRFHDRGEVQQQLAAPVLGELPFQAAVVDEPSSTTTIHGLDPTLCMYHSPRSAAAESFRVLRTGLMIRAGEPKLRVVQLTGPSPMEGCSFVSANLAISLAQAGQRVLLLDANLDHPRQHELFGMKSPARGLVPIVANEEEPGDGTFPTAINNLWLMPLGPAPTGPMELFTMTRFAELLQIVREKYDFVLIDSGPLLAGSDPCVIASHVDGVLLTVRLDKDSRRRARRAWELLQTLGLELAGVIVNGIGDATAKGYQHELTDRRGPRPPSAGMDNPSGKSAPVSA